MRMGRTYIQLSSEELAELDRRWAAIEAGEPTIPNDQVVGWLETWGTPAFRPWNEWYRTPG